MQKSFACNNVVLDIAVSRDKDPIIPHTTKRRDGRSQGIHDCDINSLATGGFDYSLKLVNFKLISTVNILSIFCKIAIWWMPQHLTDD